MMSLREIIEKLRAARFVVKDRKVKRDSKEE